MNVIYWYNMFLFCWKKILKESKGSVNATFIILEMLIKGLVPLNRKDKFYPYYDKDYTGLSFLANPKALMTNAFKYSKKEVVEYVALASFRRYADYLTYNTITLSLIESPIGKDLIKQNRLLRLEGETIHFLFEEVN